MTVEIEITEDLNTCLDLRFRVFVEEQGVPAELEQDELDATATHLLATRNGQPVGTARLLRDGNVITIGRVCVTPAARGTGLGAGLITRSVEIARDRPGVTRVQLGSQTHALAFYEKLGFLAKGPIYDDAGIPHRKMEMAL
ncbi:MAG: GNAT family N-acetyltransferase [Rhodobacteraceae bacterium]|nr:GNAT family N-acetyltransferase [Paracoccaceae bacterium]